jgi:NAD(P)H-dependent FMN reductase
MLKLLIIIASTREGRKGLPIAHWIEAEIRKDADWDVSTVDLKTLNLPMLDEPEHPRLGNYHFAHTKAWSAIVDAADAFVLVTPEYNYFAPPAIVNAVDYLSREWAYKPMGFVSYGGISGGTRSVQAVKPLVTSMKIVPLPEAVNVPFFAQMINADGKFVPNPPTEAGAAAMLSELKKWARALRPMRQPG